MGLFDQITDAVRGEAGQPAAGGSLLPALLQMIKSPQCGGLAGLIATLQQGGLGEIVNSWIATGQNQPVSPEQIQSALGEENIQALAEQLGVSRDEVSGQLADQLPQVVDQLTPDGQLPADGDLLTQGLSILKGSLFN